MELVLKVKQVGDSLAVFIPKKAANNEGIEKGTKVTVIVRKEAKQ